MGKNHKDRQWLFSNNISGESVSPGVVRKVMAYCDDAMCVVNEFAEGAVGTIHSHPHTQIIYIAEGRFRFSIGDQEKETSKGDTLCIQHCAEHGCICLEKGIVIDFFTPMREDFI